MVTDSEIHDVVGARLPVGISFANLGSLMYVIACNARDLWMKTQQPPVRFSDFGAT